MKSTAHVPRAVHIERLCGCRWTHHYDEIVGALVSRVTVVRGRGGARLVDRRLPGHLTRYGAGATRGVK